MIFRLIFIIIIALSNIATPHEVPEPTLPIKERIKFLKFKINEQLKHIKSPVQDETTLVNENYDYINLEKVPITPIMDYDERKREDKFMVRELKTTPTTTEAGWDNKPKQIRIYEDDEAGLRTEKKKNEFFAEKPVDTFYRRLVDESVRNRPVQWIHCQDIITPYLTGMKKEIGPPKKHSATDRKVQRFIQLLMMNTTSFDKDDIYAVLYQISNIQLRLFQWDVSAIRLLFNSISREKKHSFLSLKYGIRELFNRWHLDFRWNTTKLLRQARLFRPYCIDSSCGGSTLSSKITRYTKSTKRTTSECDDDDEEARRKLGKNKT